MDLVQSFIQRLKGGKNRQRTSVEKGSQLFDEQSFLCVNVVVLWLDLLWWICSKTILEVWSNNIDV